MRALKETDRDWATIGVLTLVAWAGAAFFAAAAGVCFLAPKPTPHITMYGDHFRTFSVLLVYTVFWFVPALFFVPALLGRIGGISWLAVIWVPASILLALLVFGGLLAGLLGIFGSAIGHGLGSGFHSFARWATSAASAVALTAAGARAFAGLVSGVTRNRKVANTTFVHKLTGSDTSDASGKDAQNPRV